MLQSMAGKCAVHRWDRIRRSFRSRYLGRRQFDGARFTVFGDYPHVSSPNHPSLHPSIKPLDRVLVYLAITVGLIGCASATARSGSLTPWSITFLGDSTDRRFVAVQEATQHWNLELKAVGSRLRFGSVTSAPQRIPEPVLRNLSATVLARGRVRQPAGFDRIEGDIVIALSSSPDITSIGINPERFGGRGFVTA